MTNERFKNILVLSVAFAVLVIAFASWRYVSVYSQSVQPSSFRSFAVTGTAKTHVVPDIAEFSFSIITEGGKDLSQLQKDNTEKANKAIAFLKKLGIPEKDIQTQNYNLNPRYESYACPSQAMNVRPCPPAQIVGYTINQSVLVKIRDFTKIGDAISGIVTNGANSVSQLTFTLDDADKPQQQAREEAIAKAQTKAEEIAKAGGFTLGKLLSIDDNGGYPQPVYYRKDFGMGGVATMEAQAPAIEAGSQDVSVSVTLRYEIR
jgi:uncharacterized protein YggE